MIFLNGYSQFVNRQSHRSARAGGAVLVLLLIAGCSVVSDWWADTTVLKQIGIHASEDVNDFSSVMVDVVFVRNKDLVAQLPDNAPDWFSKKKGLLFKYRKELSVRSLEVPPDFREKAIVLPEGYQAAQRVLVYANYVNLEGQLPLEITDYPVINLELQKDKVVLTQPD